MPDKIFGLTLTLDFIDRCHSLRSLYPPLAALPSLSVGKLVAHDIVSLLLFMVNGEEYSLIIFNQNRFDRCYN